MSMLDLRGAVDQQTVFGMAVVLGTERREDLGGDDCAVLDLLCASGRTRAWAWDGDAHLAATLRPGDEVEVRGTIVVAYPNAAPRLVLTALLHCDPTDVAEEEIHLTLSLPVAAHLQRLLAQDALAEPHLPASPADPIEVAALLAFLYDALPRTLRTPVSSPIVSLARPAA